MRYIYLLLLAVVFTSCAKEFRNPYDPATPPDIWMPKAFKLDTLGTNALRLSWHQDERHIDGFAIQKSTNGQLKEILLPLDSLRYTDTQAVDTSSDEVCPELSYKVMARAGTNRSLDIGTTSGIRMPLSTTAIAGTDILVTDTSTTVQLNAQAANPGERGQWTIISGTGGSFSNLNAYNSNFTGTPCNDYVLRWTKSGCTETYDEVSVGFHHVLTQANAGVNQTKTDGTTQATLNANNPGVGESGIWTIISGTGGVLENPSMPNTIFTGQSCTNYVLRWTITDVCNSSLDELNVNFQKVTTSANAGANQSITNNTTQVTLAAIAPATGETCTWTIISGSGGSFSNANSSTSTFTGNACSSYTLRWTIQGLCSTDYDDVTISYSQSNTIAYAGPDQSITTNATQVTLAANAPAAGETGTWAIISGLGGSFSDINSPDATFTGNACASYTLRWTIQGFCSSNSDDKIISFNSLYTAANAGSDIITNSLTLNLNANSPFSYENGYWEIISGNGGTFSNNQIATSSFTGLLNSTYILRWNIVSQCNSTFDDITISFPIFIQGSGVSDINLNFYPSVIIGNQEWMAKNLNTTRFCNGDNIQLVTDSSLWYNSASPAFTRYNNSTAFDNQFGKLYNWYSTVDARNICPCGWHVPSINEWNVLSNYLADNAGGKMKSTGTSIWLSPNTNATNASGFTGLPGGARGYYNSTDFDLLYYKGVWWSTSPYFTAGTASYIELLRLSGDIDFYFTRKNAGLSIRCLKN